MRRSQRHNGVPLPNNLEEQTRSAETTTIAEIYSNAIAAKGKGDNEHQTFHKFLDLPPELRARVLTYVVQKPEPIELSNAVAPLITAASKQLRTESLPAYFSANKFIVHVRTNLALVDQVDQLRQSGPLRHPTSSKPKNDRLPFIYSHTAACGSLKIRSKCKSWLGNLASEIVRFRNIEFVATDQTMRGGWGGRGVSYDTCVVSVRMATGPVGGASTIIRKADRLPHPQDFRGYDVILGQLRSAVDAATRQEEFVGFSMEDLKVMAKSFKYWPMG